MTPSTPVQESDSAPQRQVGLAAIESLARAARQVALYGPEHPIGAAAVEDACAKWVDDVGDGAAEISADRRGLLWNGEPLPAELGPVARLHEAMRERLISCIRFEPDADGEDVIALLQLLARDPQDIIDSGGAMAAFSGGSGRVRVEDVDFSRETRESEAAWLETCSEVDENTFEPLTRIFDCCLRTVRSLGDGRTLDRFRHATPEADDEGPPARGGPASTAAEENAATHIAHAIQCAGEIAMMAGEGYWEDWQAQIRSLLVALDADRRAAIFRASTTIAPGCSDILTTIARSMGTEECVSLVMDYPGAIRSEPSRGLARALARIMPDSERRSAIEPALHAEAIRRGISEDIYRNVVELLLSRIEKGEAETGQRRAWVPDAMATLTQTDREGALDPYIEALLASTSPEAVHRARVEMLLELLHADLKVNQCSAILALLAEEVTQCASSGDRESALEILNGLWQAAAPDSEGDAGRRAVAAQTLARAGSRSVVGMVASQLQQAGAEKKRELISLLAGLGDAGMSALVSLAQRPHPMAVAETVTAITRQDGTSFYWLRRLLVEANPDAIPEIIQTLVHMGNPAAMAQLSVLAEQESLSVKLALIGAIRNAGAADGAGVLERLLYDPEIAVRLEAAHGLGVMRVTSAAPALLELMAQRSVRGEGVKLRTAAMTALGEIGSEAAVPLLREFLIRARLLSPFASARLRVAAAAALARIGTASAREILEQGARSRSRAVRQACEHGLARMGAAMGPPERNLHAD